MTKKSIIIISISVLLVLVLGVWLFIRWESGRDQSLQQTVTTDYYLATEGDAGKTINTVHIGTVVIVQLTAANYGSPITVTTQDNKPVAFTTDIIDENIALSIPIATKDTVDVKAKAKGEGKTDFILTIKPQ